MKKIFLAALLFSACSNHQHVVARINGESIMASDIAAQLRIELSKYDELGASDQNQQQVIRGQILERMTMDRILLQEAKQRGIHVSPDDFFTFLSKQRLSEDEAKQHLESIGVSYEFWRRQQEQRLIIEKLIQQVLNENIPVSDDEIRKYYLAHLQAFQVTPRYHARQILLSSADVAQRVLTLLKQGQDFTTLVKTYSQAPDKDKGGVMGWLSQNGSPEIFINSLEKLKPGEYSKIVQTDYGYHIFQLLEKSPAHQRALPEVETEIIHRLQETRGNEFLKTWLKDLHDRAKVEVNQETLQTITIGESS